MPIPFALDTRFATTSARLEHWGSNVKAGSAALKAGVSAVLHGDRASSFENAKLTYQSRRTTEGYRGLENIADQLARIDKLKRNGPLGSAIIGGGGVGGLIAAYELEKAGVDVKVYEANDRLGGRFWTHRFPDGTYHELGAMRFNASDTYIRHYIDLLGLKLRKFVTANESENAQLDLGTVRMRLRDIAEIYPALGLGKVRPDSQKPEELVNFLLDQTLNSLTRRERRALFTRWLPSRRLRSLQHMSMDTFLRRRGVGDDMLRLIENTTGLRQRYKGQVTGHLRWRVRELHKGLEEVVGGTDRITTALADQVHGRIELNTKILKITPLPDGKVKLNVQHGDAPPVDEITNAFFDSIPFPVHPNTSAFDERKQRIIAEMPHMSASKVVLHTPRRLFELDPDAPIYGGASFSQAGFGATYYPSDNAIARDPAVSEKGGALLGSYTHAEDARVMGHLSNEQRIKATTALAQRYHPGLEIDGGASVFWDENPYAGGGFVDQPAGPSEQRYGEALRRQGNVFFLGDDASNEPGWGNGVAISALRAVEEFLTRAP